MGKYLHVYSEDHLFIVKQGGVLTQDWEMKQRVSRLTLLVAALDGIEFNFW